ncbi:hypothetical protein ACFOU2_16355 [Bacillus songklensis]|uniref:Uncharacterized protein n=1 Tax=Bacillus songklensis TaxID=1069116 RepID=A0ABV8B6Y6_9BACI
MEKDTFDQYENEIKRASKRGANEDIIQVSSTGYGYDLRVANPFGAGEKQESDENKNT